MTAIMSLLNQIKSNDIVLPAIQRSFVWSEDRIGMLLDSIMRGYPDVPRQSGPSAEAWRRDYNEERPHGSLEGLTPREFVERYKADSAPENHQLPVV